MKFVGQKYKQGIVIQRSEEGSAFQQKKEFNISGTESLEPAVSGGFKEVVVHGGSGPTPVVEPSIELLELWIDQSHKLDLVQEAGSQVSFSYIKHQEDNIDGFDGNLTFYINNEIVKSGIVPSAEAVFVELPSAISINTSEACKLVGVEIGTGDEVKKEINLVFEEFVYTAVSNSSTAPVASLTKQVDPETFAEDGATIAYNTGDYIYFYVKSNVNQVVEQGVLGTWVDLEAEALGVKEITLASGAQANYYAYRIGAFNADGNDTFRIRPAA